ncbi:MAG: flippase-like domain-containing protein [Bacteroidetes bacterium]|nr:flippase-like domain-containing protein [Fibrella sp.]
MMAPLLRKVLPWLVAVALLAFALRNVSFAAIGRQFVQANYALIGLNVIVSGLAYLVRGKRWQQPLRALGYQPTVLRTTVAIQAGTIAGLAIVGTGELTRCATLQRTDGVPMAQGIGSALGERVLDLLMLVPLLGLAITLELTRMTSLLAGFKLALPPFFAGWVVGGILVAGLLGFVVIRWAIRHPRVRQHPLFDTVMGIAKGLWQGFAAIRRLPSPAVFIGLTVLLQLLAWLSTYLMLLSLDSTRSLPPTSALTIMAISSIGSLLVPTQGGIGTYHFLVSRALVLYGFTTTEGAVVATFLHAVGFGINLLLSSLSFLILPSLIQRREMAMNQEVAKPTL